MGLSFTLTVEVHPSYEGNTKGKPHGFLALEKLSGYHGMSRKPDLPDNPCDDTGDADHES